MTPPPSYHELIAAHEARLSGRLEDIPGTEGRFAYNPCLIAEPGGRTLLAVRVESPGSYWRDRTSWDPEVRFYERVAGRWEPAAGTPVFPAAEDPFAAWTRDADGRPRLVFGVVTLDFGGAVPVAVTRFFAAPDVKSLDPEAAFLEVPGMKDIRLLQRAQDVVVCGRPQGGRAGIGRISVAIAGSVEAVTAELISAAHVFVDQVEPGTKLGANELFDLGDGTVGVLGHVAIGEEGSTQRYAAAWWTLDPLRRTATAPVVIATRADFPAAPAKFPAIADVVFPGALEHLPDGRLRLYCGLGDARTGSAILPRVPG
ncbi:DUF1861 family protein [Dactylosporangium sp. CA-092794]|uniref:DUF1861 family protein n=1 Tax=Dactylosporangium sp. CA-092794 TaxID=3239929 RepID=UPI003D8B4C12